MRDPSEKPKAAYVHPVDFGAGLDSAATRRDVLKFALGTSGLYLAGCGGGGGGGGGGPTSPGGSILRVRSGVTGSTIDEIRVEQGQASVRFASADYADETIPLTGGRDDPKAFSVAGGYEWFAVPIGLRPMFNASQAAAPGFNTHWNPRPELGGFQTIRYVTDKNTISRANHNLIAEHLGNREDVFDRSGLDYTLSRSTNPDEDSEVAVYAGGSTGWAPEDVPDWTAGRLGISVRLVGELLLGHWDHELLTRVFGNSGDRGPGFSSFRKGNPGLITDEEKDCLAVIIRRGGGWLNP